MRPLGECWPIAKSARVLGKTGGNKQAASRVLGVDRKTLDRMIDRHKITFRRNNGNG